MKRKNVIYLVINFFLLLLITNCKDELVVDSKKENTTAPQSILEKQNVSLGLELDPLFKKEKIGKLKKEHEKPYVVINKPEKLLIEKLKSRKTGISLSKSSNNLGTYSAQSTQSCYSIEIDIWALVKYHSITNKIVGIWPKQNASWSYNQTTLGSLKNTYGYSKIFLNRASIYANTVYNPHDILAGGNGCDPDGIINSYSDFDTTSSGSLWGLNTNEPISVQGYNNSSAFNNLLVTKTWWQQKFGSNSKIIVGETNQFDAFYTSGVADYLNCTRYTRYSWGIDDQRGLWDQFNDYFNTQFDHLWISGDLDYDEIDVLIGHAKNINKNGIWLYAAEDSVNDGFYWNSVSKFSYYSYLHNYLQREEKRFIYVWSYIGNGDPCSDNQDTSWELTDIIETDDTRIL